jgi:hypothetical protein
VSKYTAFITTLMLTVSAWAQRPQATAPAPAPLPVAASPRVDAVNHVDPGKAYYRCYAVVPIIGSGKSGDPKRPMFVPLPGEQKNDRSGILAFQMVLSDDRTMALVEFVGANRAALAPILTTTESTAKSFERGLTSKAAIEAEFQKHKKGFTLDSWTPARPQ